MYAELIRNRAFQGSDVFPSDLMSWDASKGANLSLDMANPLSAALPTSVKVTAGGSGMVSLVNEGWWGIEVELQTYTGSFYVRGAYNGQFVASLQSTTSGNTLAVTNITSKSVSDAWTQHNFTLNPTSAASDINNTFSIAYDAASATGPLNFNLLSLFPPTYNNRPNGMRVDLMENLKGIAPSFLRFPGGNNLEGSDPPHRWIWNETIGPLVDRPGRPGVWSYENTDGLGLVEYLWWCQDLNMEPGECSPLTCIFS
jgi:alpha-L-arabinofuranosidase